MLSGKIGKKIRVITSFIILNVMLISFSVESLAATNWSSIVNAISSSTISHLKEEAPTNISELTPPSTPTPESGEIDLVFDETKTVYCRSYIKGTVYEVNSILDESGTPIIRPVPGVFAYLNTGNLSSAPSDVTDHDGKFEIKGNETEGSLPTGTQDFRFRYGDLFSTIGGKKAQDEASVYEILKYNGYDYLISRITAQTAKTQVPDIGSGFTPSMIRSTRKAMDSELEYNTIKNEIDECGSGAAQVYILLDSSSSMYSGDGDKFNKAIELAQTLISDLLDGDDIVYIGIIGYAGNSWLVSGLTKNKQYLMNRLNQLRNNATSTTSQFVNNTNLCGAIEKAVDSFYHGIEAHKEDPYNHNIVIISDGIPTAAYNSLAQDDIEDYNLLRGDSDSRCKQKLSKILERTKAEINEQKSNDNVNIVAVTIEPSNTSNETALKALYDETIGQENSFKLEDDVIKVSKKVDENIRKWLHSELKKSQRTGTGWDSVGNIDNPFETRRDEIDNMFGKIVNGGDIETESGIVNSGKAKPVGVCYNNALLSSTSVSTKISAKTSIFERIEYHKNNPSKPVENIDKELSKATYMESQDLFSLVDDRSQARHPNISNYRVYLDQTAEKTANAFATALNNIAIHDYGGGHASASRIGDGEYKVTVVYNVGSGQHTFSFKVKDIPYTINMYIQKREAGTLDINATVTAARLQLNENTELAFHKRDLGSEEPLLEVLDDNVSHGTTIQLEYTISIKNLSSSSCNYLELIAYVPRDYEYYAETPILTERKKNGDYGWSERNNSLEDEAKDDINSAYYLYDKGYITQASFDNHINSKTHKALTLRICDPNYDGNETTKNYLCVENFYIIPGKSFEVKLVLSKVIDLAEDCTGSVMSEFEILGYRNSSKRRMSEDIPDEDNDNFSRIKYYTPGNNSDGLTPSTKEEGIVADFSKERDYTTQSNLVLIVPPTGTSHNNNDDNILLIIVPIVTIIALSGIFYFTKKKHKK